MQMPAIPIGFRVGPYHGPQVIERVALGRCPIPQASEGQIHLAGRRHHDQAAMRRPHFGLDVPAPLIPPAEGALGRNPSRPKPDMET